MFTKRMMTATAVLLALALLAAACGDDDQQEQSGLPNPASVFCEEQGGTLEIREEAGGQVGYCAFDDGSECEEWAFYRGECAPGEAVIGGNAGIPNPASVFCEEQGGISEIVTAADGSQSGVCKFSDGSQCDEWAFFRGECAPGA
jgi:putative hemolysin